MLLRRAVITAIFTLLFLLPVTMTSCSQKNNSDGLLPDDGLAGGETELQYLDLSLYYLKVTDENAYLVREVHRTPYVEDGYTAALNELISGEPATNGAIRILPESTVIRNVTVKDGELTVDFSSEVLTASVGGIEEWLGIMSIVNTLTEFAGIDQASFLVEGAKDERTMNWWGHVGLYDQPFRRDLSMVFEPAIWVNQPAPGQGIASPLTVSGSAMVPGKTVYLRLLDISGNEVADGSTTVATDPAEWGSERGSFAVSLLFPKTAGEGVLEVFWKDAENEEQDLFRVHVDFD